VWRPLTLILAASGREFASKPLREVAVMASVSAASLLVDRTRWVWPIGTITFFSLSEEYLGL
jgi:hypothetical protein